MSTCEWVCPSRQVKINLSASRIHLSPTSIRPVYTERYNRRSFSWKKLGTQQCPGSQWMYLTETRSDYFGSIGEGSGYSSCQESHVNNLNLVTSVCCSIEQLCRITGSKVVVYTWNWSLHFCLKIVQEPSCITHAISDLESSEQHRFPTQSKES